MAAPAAHLDLTAFSALSFDVFGTLVDQSLGYWTGLAPLLSQLPPSSPYHPPTQGPILALLNQHERHLEETHPTLPYPSILALAYEQLAKSLDLPAPSQAAARTFGESQGKWPAFPDTVAALNSLGRRYKLIILSNTSEAMIAQTLGGPLAGAKFDAVYTAEVIGSYKPDVRNFEFLMAGAQREFAVPRERILHVAHSLEHDHVPVKIIGLHPGVWIRRGEGEAEKAVWAGRIGLGAEFETMGDFAREVERAFGGFEIGSVTSLT